MENKTTIIDRYFQDVLTANGENVVNEKPKVENVDLVETTQNKPIAKPKETLQQKLLSKVVKYAETSNEVLSQQAKSLAVDIITMTNNAILSNTYGATWNSIDILGCNLIGQIKNWAKIGVSTNDKLWIDIRRNKNKPGFFDVSIKPQFQTLEKIIVKYFHKDFRVLRFKEDVLCVGDNLVIEEDFSTGLDKITKHERNTQIDRNKLDNIVGAYKIIYVQNIKTNELFSYLVRIDRNRIDRAMNASSSKDKAVWKSDSRKMVLKTVAWELYNDKNVRPFLVFPEELANDIHIIEESSEMDWNNEKKYETVSEAQAEIKDSVAQDDIIDMKYED